MTLEKSWIVICRGWSSYPFLRDSSILHIVAVSPAEIRRGDLAVVQSETLTLCHRVIGKRRRQGRLFFLTKGDASVCADGWFDEIKIQGRVESVDGWKTRSLSFRWLSVPFLFISRAQHTLYTLFFRSALFAPLRRIKQQCFPRAQITPLFLRLTLPWLPKKRR